MSPRAITLKIFTLHWRHNDCDGVSTHQLHGCLLNCLFRRRSKKTSKLRVTGLCVGNSPGTGEFPAQMASIAENVSLWWRHHDMLIPFPGKEIDSIKRYKLIALSNHRVQRDCWYTLLNKDIFFYLLIHIKCKTTLNKVYISYQVMITPIKCLFRIMKPINISIKIFADYY